VVTARIGVTAAVRMDVAVAVPVDGVPADDVDDRSAERRNHTLALLAPEVLMQSECRNRIVDGHTDCVHSWPWG